MKDKRTTEMNTRGIFPSSKVIITLKVQTKDSQTQLPKAEYKYTAAKYEKIDPIRIYLQR